MWLLGMQTAQPPREIETGVFAVFAAPGAGRGALASALPACCSDRVRATLL